MIEFNKKQIEILKGSYSAISRAIKSPSARSPHGHLSRYYVMQVIKGRIDRDNVTTREIKNKAKQILAILGPAIDN